MTDAPGARTPEPDGPAPLRTEPRPLVVHWLVDSAVLAISLVLGAGAARLTHQADVRAMAERRAG